MRAGLYRLLSGGGEIGAGVHARGERKGRVGMVVTGERQGVDVEGGKEMEGVLQRIIYEESNARG